MKLMHALPNITKLTIESPNQLTKTFQANYYKNSTVTPKTFGWLRLETLILENFGGYREDLIQMITIEAAARIRQIQFPGGKAKFSATMKDRLEGLNYEVREV